MSKPMQVTCHHKTHPSHETPRNSLLFTTVVGGRRGICNTTLFTKLLTTAFMSFFCNSTTFWRTGSLWTSFFPSFYGSFLCSSTWIFSFLMLMLKPYSKRGHKQKFKYPYPRDSKIIQMPYPWAKMIDQIPALCPVSPLPCWLDIDRCITWVNDHHTGLKIISSSFYFRYYLK